MSETNPASPFYIGIQRKEVNIHEQSELCSAGKALSKVMVIDFGGGTLDLSILNLQHNKVYEDAVYGVKFGGDDIDKELAMRIMPKVYPGIPFEELESKKKDKLMNEVERMKIEFSEYDD